MNFEGKKVLVIGTGLSGTGAVEMLSALGAQVTLLEQNEKAEEEKIRSGLEGALSGDRLGKLRILVGALPKEEIFFRDGKEGTPGFDLIVPSPAVPLDSPLILKMTEAGVPVISEIELGFLNEKGKVIAITGTNGKTTTTTLMGDSAKPGQPNPESPNPRPPERAFHTAGHLSSATSAGLMPPHRWRRSRIQ